MRGVHKAFNLIKICLIVVGTLRVPSIRSKRTMNFTTTKGISINQAELVPFAVCIDETNNHAHLSVKWEI